VKKILFIFLLFCSALCLGFEFPANTSYDVCFTPDGNCTGKIVSEIKSAQKEVLVQAYTFTSYKVANALVKANKHGVAVKILFDKSALLDKHSLLRLFKQNHVWIKIDYLPDIAHNKVIVIDKSTVITGSFNFTIAAQKHNAENVLIIHDSNLAKIYIENWKKRATKSKVAKEILV
jgi:phospholipase D